MAAEIELHAKVLYRGNLIEVKIDDVYTDSHGHKRVVVRALEGKPFPQWNVVMADPKYGGGHGWESRSAWHTVSVILIKDVWEMQDGKMINHLGPPPIVKQMSQELGIDVSSGQE
ncbi:MAG: hypothetical protein DWQ07_12665 [Chloroflexi bacterium]|nr:MAG: hypothetical protein DWQ07_12665 [Chloroflexota bacterium]MBL1196891.1 hypothetical protein [Chloroflexota bacterium]NOH14187.1 hypothetical protein [Chloroflexota bacterium]